MKHLRATGSHIILAPLDLPTEEGTSQDGVHYSGQVDPSTGLLLAGDRIHVPAAVILSSGPRAVPHLPAGAKVIVQRVRRDQTYTLDTPKGEVPVQSIRTTDPCTRCGKDIPNDAVLAVIDREVGISPTGDPEVQGDTYKAVGARVLVAPDPPPAASDIIEVIEDQDDPLVWGKVTSIGEDTDLHVGDRVAWERGAGATWSEGTTTYTSLRTGRHCPGCGRLAFRGDVQIQVVGQ